MNFWPEQLKDIASSIFCVLGTPEPESRTVADHLVSANLLGFDSHGVIRINQYVSEIKAKSIIPGSQVSVTRETPTSAVVDVGWNFGQVGGEIATKVLIEKVKKSGLAFVVLERSNHVGCVSVYTRMAAKNDIIAIAFCGSPGNGHMVCPFGGIEGRLSPGPISYAIPTNSDPIVADFSTSSMAEGKIRLLRNNKCNLDEDCVLDHKGIPTIDPNAFYEPHIGVILPFGAKQGYKGFAYSIMNQVLSTQLAGINWRPDLDTARGNSMSILGIDIKSFTEPEKFRTEMSSYVDYLKSSKPAEGFNEILVPGEIENKTFQKRSLEGIPIDDVTTNQIMDLAKELKISKHPPMKIISRITKKKMRKEQIDSLR